MSLGILGTYGDSLHEIYINQGFNSISFVERFENLYELFDEGIFQEIAFPLESTLFSASPAILECLASCNGFVIQEYYSNYLFEIASKCDMQFLEKLYLDRRSLEICAPFLKKSLTVGQNIETPSLELAAIQYANESKKSDKVACITTSFLASKLNLPIRYSDLSFGKTHAFRSWHLSKNKTSAKSADKHSFCLRPRDLSQGVIAFLNEGALLGLKLISVQSAYLTHDNKGPHFFVDFQGSCCDNDLSKLMSKIQKFGEVKLLGSYKTKYEQKRARPQNTTDFARAFSRAPDSSQFG